MLAHDTPVLRVCVPKGVMTFSASNPTFTILTGALGGVGFGVCPVAVPTGVASET